MNFFRRKPVNEAQAGGLDFPLILAAIAAFIGLVLVVHHWWPR